MQTFFVSPETQGKVRETGENCRERTEFPLYHGGRNAILRTERTKEPLVTGGRYMTRWKKCVLAVLAAASLTGTAAGAAGLYRDVPASAQTQTESRTGSVIRLTNAARQQNGVALLEADSGLARAAAVRAQEISRSFSHTRPGGGSFVSALSESGVAYRSAGENIASGQSSADEVVRAWLASPGHRANILAGRYSRIGAAAIEVNGTTYWVQLFAD